MILLYLWVDEFRVFKNQGFDLSSQFEFDLVQVSNGKVKEFNLTISRRAEYCNIFPNVITDVIGIVGKNGAGKSTLIQLLAMLYGKANRIAASMIMCFLNPETNEIDTFYFHGERRGRQKLRVNVFEGENVAPHKIYEASPYHVDRFIGLGGQLAGIDERYLNKPLFALLSNGFTQHPQEVYEGIANLSMSKILDDYIGGLLKAEMRKETGPKDESEKKKLIFFPTNLADFRFQVLEDWVRFIASARQSKIRPDFIPKVIQIKFTFSPLVEIDSTRLRQAAERFVKYVLASVPVKRQRGSRERFFNLTFLSVILVRVQQIASHNSKIDIERAKQILQEASFGQEGNRATLTAVLGELINVGRAGGNSSVQTTDLVIEIENAVRAVEFRYSDEVEVGSFSFEFPIEIRLLKLLQFVFNLNYNGVNSPMRFSFGKSLSAGEEAKLNLYAKLYKVAQAAGPRNVVLAIDEGDLYYHPDWQRTYLNELFEVLDFFFRRGKVQLVLSTHSPFIVSDLPRGHLIFLEQIRPGECVVQKVEGRNETFGTNIHELFMDSFFLNEGLMGEFAARRINGLFEKIEKLVRIDQDTYEALMLEINLIGEHFLKSKLMEMVADKADVEIVREIIANRELEVLRMILKSKDNDPDNKQ